MEKADIEKLMNELFAIYDNCDVDFRKKYFQDEKSLPVCKEINEYPLAELNWNDKHK